MQNLSLPDTRIANAKRITYTSLVGGGGRARTQTLASNAIRSLGLEVFGPRVLAVRARACVMANMCFHHTHCAVQSMRACRHHRCRPIKCFAPSECALICTPCRFVVVCHAASRHAFSLGCAEPPASSVWQSQCGQSDFLNCQIELFL